MAHEHYLAAVMLTTSYVVPHKRLHSFGPDVGVESGLESVGEFPDDGFKEEFLKVEIGVQPLALEDLLLQVLLQGVYKPVLSC